VNVLLLAADTLPNDPLLADLVEGGHEVRSPREVSDPVAPRSAGGGSGRESRSPPAPWKPQVFLIRLDTEPARVLDEADLLARTRSWGDVPLLFTGGNELALAAARRRFPDASFVREDHVATALASLESGE
jgi:hypothetical protein